MARVAVIVPCFQSARFIRETVVSVMGQTLGSWSLVVVDDGSTDDPRSAVADLLEADDRLSFVSKQNGGVASARNFGVGATPRPEYYLFLDADDVLEPTMLATLAGWLDRHRSAAAAYCAPSFIDASGNSLPPERWFPRLRPSWRGVTTIPDDDPVTPFESIFCLAGMVPSTALIRAYAYERTPGWDESFGQGFEDTLLFLHLALTGEVHHLPERLVRHRRHGESDTAESAHMSRQRDRLYEWWRWPPGLTASELATVRRAQKFRDRRVVPRQAIASAGRLLARRRPQEAARHVGGAARIVLRSYRGARGWTSSHAE